MRKRKGTAPAACVHHWVIATPDGHFSRGTCKRCGRERDFENSESEGAWRRRRSGMKETGQAAASAVH